MGVGVVGVGVVGVGVVGVGHPPPPYTHIFTNTHTQLYIHMCSTCITTQNRTEVCNARLFIMCISINDNININCILYRGLHQNSAVFEIKVIICAPLGRT